MSIMNELDIMLGRSAGHCEHFSDDMIAALINTLALYPTILLRHLIDIELIVSRQS